MNLMEEIKGNAFSGMEEDFDSFLKEDINTLLESVSISKMNNRIDKLTRIGVKKKITGIEGFGKIMKELFAQLDEAQKGLEQANKDNDLEAKRKYRKRIKVLKKKSMSSYKTFKNGVSSHRKTFMKFMFAIMSVVGMFLFVGVRATRRNKYSMLMSSLKDDVAANKEEFSAGVEKKIDAEFDKIIKDADEE